MELYDPAARPLPLGSIRPRGWAARQLRIQAAGLSGNLDKVWPDIRESRWSGGKSEGWERFPYWLDGAIPLAFQLEDDSFRQNIDDKMDYIMRNQHADGWLGPREMVTAGSAASRARYDLWAQILMVKVLDQYRSVSDQRTDKVLMRLLRSVEKTIQREPLFNWGQFRWFEALPGIFRLYQESGEKWLRRLALKLACQGFDWQQFFREWPYRESAASEGWSFMSHVVNNAMAVKAPILWWRMTGDSRLLRSARKMISLLDRYHGMPTGVFSGDECLAGLDPTQGTELCAVMEYAFSLETAAAVSGDPWYADRLEQVVFNALPAAFSPDMWAHQYDQQLNQIECSVRDDWPWTTNGPESNIYGLEPGYGCCTANLSQGWPKFVSHLWLRREGGLSAISYTPAEITTTAAGVPIKLEVDSKYPFREEVCLGLHTQMPVEFPLFLRIPKWCQNPRIFLTKSDGSEERVALQAKTGGEYRRIERIWRDGESITLHLPMKPEVHPGNTGGWFISRGPLVYALAIKERWEQIHGDLPGRNLPHGDWEVFPESPWNIGLLLGDPPSADGIVFQTRETGERPFSPEGVPVFASLPGMVLPEWKKLGGRTGPIPKEPQGDGKKREVTLIPYGATNLRVTEFPLL